MTPQGGNAAHRVRVFGHERAVGALLTAARTGRAGQAYLVAGPPGVGKRTVARAFAQAMLCDAAPADRPCGACRACRMVAQDVHPDVHLGPVPLRVDDVRGLQRGLALAPVEARQRVALLAEIDRASGGAANSLLKTLEEPPTHALLLLTTSVPEAVLPTIRSRCRIVPLRPLAPDEARRAIEEGLGVPAERAALLARLSAGRPGWAMAAVDEGGALAGRDEWLGALAEVRGVRTAGRLELAERLAEGSGGLDEGLVVWRGWWRDVLLVRHGVRGPVVNNDRLAELEAAAGRYSVPAVIGALRAVETALERLAANANPRLVLEALVLALPAAGAEAA
jgi:DNA polymerase-3 subunit delta'